jgi:hypothetical protein
MYYSYLQIIKEQNKVSDITIYFDLDGVMADWEAKYKEYYKDDPSKIPDDILWPKVIKIKNFWENIPPIKDTIKLFRELQNEGFNVEILSAYSHYDTRSISGKRKWLQKNLSPINYKVNLVRRRDKQKFATMNSILIDDMSNNTKEFKNAGGNTVLFKDSSQTRRQVYELLNYLLK